MKPTPLALAIALTTSPALSMAQTLEEVVVTAQKRSENLQETAVSITALSGDTLTAMNVKNTGQLAQVTPNLTIQSDRPGQSFPAIRGIGTPIKGPGVDQGVAIYLDGVQVDSSGANLLSVLDLQQVEVLKGPQGTLYGRNAVGGVINMVSRTPADEFQGYVRAGAGNYGSWETGASIEGPIIANTLKGRLSGIKQQNNSYYDNRTPGAENNGASEDVTVRGSLVWNATDNLEVTFASDYSDTKTSGPAWRSVGISNIQAKAAVLSGLVVPTFEEPDNNVFKLSHNLETLNNSEIYGGSITLKYALSENIELVSITGYRETEQELLEDLDASPNQYLEVASATSFRNATQELRMHYTDDTLLGVVGLFYNDSKNENIFSVDAFAEFLPVAGGAEPSTTSRGGETEAWSLFTQWDWSMTDQLTLTLGARYSDSEKSTFRNETSFTEIDGLAAGAGLERCFILAPGVTPAQQPACLTQIVPGAETNATGDGDWSNFTPKLGLRYEINDDHMVFASYSQGYRDGGLAGSASEFSEFDEEVVDAYELGFKSEFAERTIRLNGSVFYYDYQDLQLQLTELSGNNVFTKVFNAGEAEMFGTELELTWLVTENFSVIANMGYLDTEITKLDRGPGVDFGFIQEGNEFPQAPEITASLIPEFNFEMFGGTLLWRTEINYTDEYFEDAENGAFANEADAGSLTGANIVDNGFVFDPSLVVAPGTKVDDEVYEARTIVNTSLMYTTAGGDLDITLWARNLTEEEYQESRGYVAGVIYTRERYGLPRTFGIKAQYRF